MNCKDVQDSLIFYIESELNPHDNEQVGLHLQNCPECQYLFNQLKCSLDFINNEKQKEVNPFFVTRVMEGLKQSKVKQGAFDWLKIKQYSLQVAVYSIMIAFSLFIGYYLGKDKSNVDQANISKGTEVTDNQLFAESYQFQATEDVYLVSNEEKADQNGN